LKKLVQTRSLWSTKIKWTTSGFGFGWWERSILCVRFLKQNQRGQLTTTPTLQVVDPEIFALGDLADCRDAEGQQVPTTAQAAFQQADYAGWNLWASLTNRPLLPFRYQHL